MTDVHRRDFLRYSAVGAAAAAAASTGLPSLAAAASIPPAPPGAGDAATGAAAGARAAPYDPHERYDLIITGGEVLDPSHGRRARLDIGITNGRIRAVHESLSADRAARVLPVPGMLVVPGLVDLHAHVYPQASAIGLPPDELVPLTATTTYVSAGDAGANNVSGFAHWVAAQARTRIFGFVHIANMGLAGFPVGEMLNIDYADVDRAAAALVEYPELLIGVKVRQSKSIVGTNGLHPLQLAIKAAEGSGTGARVMCHIGDVPGDLSTLLDLLRPGDVLTHTYAGSGNNIVRRGRLLPAALEAQQRGVVMDVGHGGGSFEFAIARPALDQGLLPDTISSDLHAVSINTPGTPVLPWVMSKFLALGLDLEEVVRRATTNPARVIDRVEGLGTLTVGAPADVSVLELVEEPVTFIDTAGKRLRGDRYLRPVTAVRAGRPFATPYPGPVPYPQPFGFPLR